MYLCLQTGCWGLGTEKLAHGSKEMSAVHESAEGLSHLSHLHTHPITRNSVVRVPTWACFKQTLKCAKSRWETAQKHVDRGDKKHAQRSTDNGWVHFSTAHNCHLRASNRSKRDPDADVDDKACAEERKEKEDSELKNTSVAKCREMQTRDLFPKVHILAKKSWLKQAFSIILIKVLFHSGLKEYRCCSRACWLTRIAQAHWREVNLYTFNCLHLYLLAVFIHSIYSSKPTFQVKHFQKSLDLFHASIQEGASRRH